MLYQGLSSTERLPADMTGAVLGVVLLSEVSVQSLHEGCPLITDVTLPWLVVPVVSVHVVHHPSEAPTLLAAQLTDAELLTALGYFPLCNFAHWPRFW